MVYLCSLLYVLSTGMAAMLHGGSFGNPPRFIRQFIWSILITIPVSDALSYHVAWSTWMFMSIFCLVACFAGKACGTGDGMDYGRVAGSVKNDTLRMTLISVLSVSGAVVMFMAINPLAGLTCACIAALGGPAGLFGWWLSGDDNKLDNPVWDEMTEGTKVNEFLRGFFAGLGVIIAYIMVMNV